jgi:hypothetical protein
MEFRLIHSGASWECQVKLRVKNLPEKNFGASLSVADNHELEFVLRRAQLALLNPSEDYKKFIDLDLSCDRVLNNSAPFGNEKQLSFSPDTVCVEIRSPDLIDLTFIDLPGKQIALLTMHQY